MTDKAFMPPPASKTEEAAAEQVRDEATHGRVVLQHYRRWRLPAHGTTRFEILKIPREITPRIRTHFNPFVLKRKSISRKNTGLFR
jgi:hypothetical protein